MEIKSKSTEMDEEREEGELTEEEFEDVSDSSISMQSLESIIFYENNMREPFKELSLTSVSEESSDNVAIVNVCKVQSNQAKLSRNGNYQKYCKHRRYEREYSPVQRVRYTKRRHSKIKASYQKQYSTVSSSSTSESEHMPDRKVLRQLRDAVRISSNKKNLNCSLRTRLKRMIDPKSPTSDNNSDDDEDDLESLRNQALKSKPVNNNQPEEVALGAPTEEVTSEAPTEEVETKQVSITDEDLINLRLIALKSAVLKKHENRRKYKKQIEKKENSNVDKKDIEVETPAICDNKIDDGRTIVTHLINEMIDKITNDVNSKIPKESQTVLSSEMKLETASEVKPEEVKEKQKTNPDEDEDILRAMLLTSISKRISNKIPQKSAEKNIPKVTSNATTVSNTKPSKKITSTHTLTAPTVPVKRLVININSDSESDVSPVVKKKKVTESKPAEKNNIFEENLTNFLKQARIKSEIQQQSDISKHLPRSQQLEYRHLKRKLQQLSKLKSHAKLKKDGDENKRIRLNSASKKSSKLLNSQQKTSPGGKKQTNNIDRLHIKGKYEGLTPLMLKVSQARTARDNAQTEVKQLINDLRNARIKLTSTHKTYTMLIQQLLQAKAELDERANVLNSREKEKPIPKILPKMCTSTPISKEKVKDVCEISNITLNASTISVLATETVIENVTVKENEVSKEGVNMDIANKLEEVNEIRTIELKADENEIEEVEMKIEDDKLDDVRPAEDNRGLTKYKSPLDHIQNNSDGYVGNPLMVFCPYDLLGVCRDPDCTYRHQ